MAMFNSFSLSRHAVVAFLFCLFVSIPDFLSAQPSTAPFEDGPLQDISEKMSELVRLKIVNRKLELRRDWGESARRGDRQDQIDKEVEKLKARGFDQNTAVRLAERIQRTADSETPFSTAFFALTSNLSGSLQRTSSGSKRTMKFRNPNMSASAQLTIPENDVQMLFGERKEPNRQLVLAQSDDGMFVFKYSGDDFLVELRQEKNGRVQLVRMLEEKKETYQGLDFVGLRKQHPEIIDQWLLPLMEHSGVSIPVLAENEEIVDAVLAKLEAFSQRADEFERLVKQLNAREYETRNMATEKIVANRSLWQGQIEKKLEQQQLPLETRVRLQSAMSLNHEESQVDQLIRDQDLLNSPEYLVSLLGVANANQSKLIVRRLKQITGLPFSTAAQWRAWSKDQLERPKAIGDQPRNEN